MTEYRLMLADKLVNNLAYDTDKEVQNLELLKLRFGESSMHHCEIMVRFLGRCIRRQWIWGRRVFLAWTSFVLGVVVHWLISVYIHTYLSWPLWGSRRSCACCLAGYQQATVGKGAPAADVVERQRNGAAYAALRAEPIVLFRFLGF